MEGKQRYIAILVDPNLSLLEISSYLENREVSFVFEDISSQALVLAINGYEAKSLMRNVGGIFKLCELKIEAQRVEELESKIGQMTWYPPVSEKATWTLSRYCARPNDSVINNIQEYFASKLIDDGISKARFVTPKPIESADGFSVEVTSDELLRRGILNDGFEITLVCLKKKILVGCTVSLGDIKDFRERDFERPVQRPEMSLSPRLARILVNLAGPKKGKTLLDPFCGIGTILQEAVVLGLEVLGVDIEKRRVDDTKRNLNWLASRSRVRKFDLDNRIKVGDARRLSRIFGANSIDSIVTEPILLPAFKDSPRREVAYNLIRKVESTYRAFIGEAESVLRRKGRLVIVSPTILAKSGESVRLEINGIASERGLKPYVPNAYKANYPITIGDKRRKKVLRGIYVFEKP